MLQTWSLCLLRSSPGRARRLRRESTLSLSPFLGSPSSCRPLPRAVELTSSALLPAPPHSYWFSDLINAGSWSQISSFVSLGLTWCVLASFTPRSLARRADPLSGSQVAGSLGDLHGRCPALRRHRLQRASAVPRSRPRRSLAPLLALSANVDILLGASCVLPSSMRLVAAAGTQECCTDSRSDPLCRVSSALAFTFPSRSVRAPPTATTSLASPSSRAWSSLGSGSRSSASAPPSSSLVALPPPRRPNRGQL